MTAWIVTGPTSIEEVETVVQYAEDGSNAREVAAIVLGSNAPSPHAPVDSVRKVLDREGFEPGDWLAKKNHGLVTVHDTDPRVEAEWEVCRKPIYSPSHTSNATRVTHRRPTYDLGNGWTITGPWTEVEG